MTVVAPYSKYRRTNCLIAIVAFVVIGGWCVYDGYINENFITEHTNPDGSMQDYLKINRTAPYIAGAGIIGVGIFWLTVRDKKVVADDNELTIDNKQKIPYTSIEQIDRTHFDSKGFFIISYKKPDGQNALKAFSYKRYDNLKSLLDHLVTKIT
jgi:hypothetical protein